MSTSSFDTGDTAWMLSATALVLLMTMPGLAIYYSGMTREKNVLHCVMQIFTICSLITVLWLIFGYSLAFAPTNATCVGMNNVNAVYGSGQRLWLLGNPNPIIPYSITQPPISLRLLTHFTRLSTFSSPMIFPFLWLLGMGLLSFNQLAPTIPEALFCAYQLTFAIITAALICGSFAERLKVYPVNSLSVYPSKLSRSLSLIVKPNLSSLKSHLWFIC